MKVADHEEYPNAPLAFVTVEVRFTGDTDAVLDATSQRLIRNALGDQWVMDTINQQEVSINFTPGQVSSQDLKRQQYPRYVMRDRTTSIVITPKVVSVETTKYLGWIDFRNVLKQALDAVSNLMAPEAITRLGMRYVNEVRVPTTESVFAEWKLWLPVDVLAPGNESMEIAGYKPLNWTGAAQYAVDNDMNLVVRYGPRSSYAVNPVGPLRRDNAPQDGPLFVLDFDAFWEPSNIPLFEVDDLLERCDSLRRPIWTLFELLTTDKLKHEIFKKGLL